MMKRCLAWCVLSVWLTWIASAQMPVPIAAPRRPIPAIEHVLIISIDGLRPDRALIANMPNLRSLVNSGSYTFWAKTTPNATTLPSHVSMLTGVSPRKHGIEWNRDLPLSEPIYPLVPTIFEIARRSGYSTAAIVGKSKFDLFNKPGALTYAAIPSESVSSNEYVIEHSGPIIEEHKPQLMFVHFPDVDSTGHAKGWGSPEQLQAIEKTDTQLGQLFAQLDRAGIRPSTFIILTSDHGGAGRSHGPDDFRSRYIPWIVNGPGVRAHFDLTQISDLEIRTEDTAATACYLLGLRLPPNFDGKPVMAIFAQPSIDCWTRPDVDAFP